MVSLHSSSPWNDGRSAALEVRLLGVVDYESALFLQERLVYEVSGRRDSSGLLLLCEHPPLITIGREGGPAQLRLDAHELTARQWDVRWINRGGGCLLHAPGQLAVYPIVPLNRLGLGLGEYRRALESAVIEVCARLGVCCERREQTPGVWCRLGQVVHIGIAVRSWVAYHGLFVNVAPDLRWQRVVESGGGDVSSLAAARVRPLAMHSVRAELIPCLAERLGYERYHIFTGHPLLRRARKKVYVHA